MNWFPQIGQGSVTQFPFIKTRNWRAIRNEVESGERILLPDSGAGQGDWNLSYQDLSDDEAGRLRDLFTASQGSYRAFAFADPLANLLAWSEDLTRPDWQMGLLTATGTPHGWTLTNGSPGDQALTQTISLPGEYVTCFSAWLRADAPCEATLQRDATQAKAALGSEWKRFFVSGAGGAGATNSAYSIVVPAGKSIQMWGPQVEAQPYPSQYKPSATAAGIYEETYFGSDEQTIVSTAPGLYSAEVKLQSRV